MSEHRYGARQILVAEDLAWLRDRPDIVGRAAADAAHTALEAMRREGALMRALLDPDLCAYCCHEDCAATFRAVDPASGLRYCPTHAPAGSVQVVP